MYREITLVLQQYINKTKKKDKSFLSIEKETSTGRVTETQLTSITCIAIQHLNKALAHSGAI